MTNICRILLGSQVSQSLEFNNKKKKGRICIKCLLLMLLIRYKIPKLVALF